MKICFLLFLSLCFVRGLAQLDRQKKYNALEKSKSFKDLPDSVKRMLFQKKSELATPENAKNDMPVLKPQLYGVYSGNNGNGSDMYAMKPYNMPCLVPDSTFRSNMPVSRSTIRQSPVELRRKENR